ncbi:MAG: endonuclease, partial [Pseudomonadota bacterium]|nr:endonuclease [Pseudomonadota bacterium]
MKNHGNRYQSLIEDIFWNKYKEGSTRVEFIREDLEFSANKLNIKLPKNLGDVIYSFKFRAELPENIIKTAKKDKEWVIKNVGRAMYVFEQVTFARILPDFMMASIKIPDATPAIVAKYALIDEQALLAKLRYNRLIDIFTGVTCFSVQN